MPRNTSRMGFKTVASGFSRASGPPEGGRPVRFETASRFMVIAIVVLAAATPGHTAGPASIADAAMQGDRASVLALIKQGADVNAPQGDGVTALHWAARRGDAGIVTAMVAAGSDPRAATRFGAYTPLHLAAERGSAAITKTLLAAGAPVDPTTNTGTTPLMFAAAAGDVAAITTLLDKGAGVNAEERD